VTLPIKVENASPDWVDGVPVCSELCLSHDGKRCELLGLRAPRVCEPTVAAMTEALAEERTKLEAAEKRIGESHEVLEAERANLVAATRAFDHTRAELERWRPRAEAAERERDHALASERQLSGFLKDQTARANRQEARAMAAETRATEAEAREAAMREVLEYMARRGLANLANLETAATIDRALSSTAGKELLERLRKAETLVGLHAAELDEAAARIAQLEDALRKIEADGSHCPSCRSECVVRCSVRVARAALGTPSSSTGDE
jgi:DNA repair exonuclease SbcCD ATPase subunit